MPHSVITSKGQITIPKSIRKKLNLKTGDRVDFKMSDSEVVLTPVTRTASDVFGVLSKKIEKPVSTREMHDRLADSMRKKWNEGA